MKNLLVALAFISFVIISPLVNAIVEEDWENYTRADSGYDSGISVTLSMLRKTSVHEDFTVTVRDFDPEGLVVLDVYQKDRKETIFLEGKRIFGSTSLIILTEPVEIFNRTMIITPKRIVPPGDFLYAVPEVEINIDILKPELELTFNPETDPEEYFMFKEIPLEIDVRNKGDSEISDTEIYIDSDGLEFENGRSYYQLPMLVGDNQKDLKGTTNQTIKLKLKFPSTPDQINYTVHAYVKGVNKGTVYFNDASKNITIKPSIGLQKSVTMENMLISNKEMEKIYTILDSDNMSHWPEDGTTYVSLGVTNYQNYEIKGIELQDKVSRTMTIENISLNWTFDLKPYETKEIKYMLKATVPGNITHSSALLTYSEFNMSWSVNSSKPNTQVHGPCIQVLKRADKPILLPGENGTVTMAIRNIGDMPSKVLVIDKLPENSTYLGGNLSYGGVIQPKESAEISYSFSTGAEGQIQLPGPRIYVNDRDYKGCGEQILSRILIQEPSTPTPVPPRSEPFQILIKKPERSNQTSISLLTRFNWLEGVIPAMMLVLAIAVLFMLHRSSE